MLAAETTSSSNNVALLITTIGGIVTTLIVQYFASKSRKEQTTKLHAAIETNTEESKKAFNEANSVNLKIAALAGDKAALEELGRRTLKEHDAGK